MLLWCITSRHGTIITVKRRWRRCTDADAGNFLSDKRNRRTMQAQFLDEQHLLLALGPPDASALRHAESQQQAAFLAVFSLQARPHCWTLRAAHC